MLAVRLEQGSVMASITFYRQARKDGGIRTGVDVDDNVVLQRFEAGSSDGDPSIVWYVDVRCSGRGLPATAVAARQWLLRNRPTVRRLLISLAEALPLGVDPGSWPVRKSVRLAASS